MSVPNRAEHPNRKMGDHETPLIQLHGGMRPSGTSIAIQRPNDRGGFDKLEPHGIYATESADKVHELLHGVKNLAAPGTRIHAEVTYHPDDVMEERAKVAKQVSEQGYYTEAAMPSGASRQLAIHAEAKRRVPTKAGTSFTA